MNIQSEMINDLWSLQREKLARGETVPADQFLHGSGCPCPKCTSEMEYWKRHRDWMEKAEAKFIEMERKLSGD